MDFLFARHPPNGSKGMYLKVVISTAVYSLPVIFRALYLSLHPREQINDSARRVFSSRRDCILSLLYYVGSSPCSTSAPLCSILFDWSPRCTSNMQTIGQSTIQSSKLLLVSNSNSNLLIQLGGN